MKLAVALMLSLASACGSTRAVRHPAPDAPLNNDGGAGADGAAGPDNADDAPTPLGADAPGLGMEAGARDEGTSPSDGGDAPVDRGGGWDSPVDGGGQVDGGLDGGGMVACNFAGVSPGLTCADGQYCMSFTGGPVGSVATYSCANFPEECQTDRSCECLCQRASSGSTWACHLPGSSGGGCTCIPREGSLSLLCAAP